MNDYLKAQIKELEEKIAEVQKLSEDPSMESLAKEELSQLNAQKTALEASASSKPSSDVSNNSNVLIMEIRSAAGGDEAGLFAADLYRMYTRYAISKNWKVEDC